MDQSIQLDKIGRRYLLGRELGQGGMGVVFQATDRLNGQSIALKRVRPDNIPQLAATMSEDRSLSLALAQEFKMLASLRHPHIISVLDYGFDEFLQPYFTMELLEQPVPFVAAAKNSTIDQKIGLIIQLLQALVYLHRRNVLHRDLKPENVSVVGDHVKVLDFGLSVMRAQLSSVTGTSGTLAYMAPEVLQGEPASELADLYAVGVMAYEIFAGFYPFDRDNISKLIDQALNRTPDFSVLPDQPEVAPIIARLMAKDPVLRYQSAAEVISEFSSVMGWGLPPETAAIRESFLQSSQLVGRDKELEHFAQVLNQAMNKEGSVWLIGGESGVGKSRLLDEIRSLALVQGVLVIREQAVSEGSNPYQLWSNSLRWLTLLEPTDFEASVLKPLIPDIQTLIDREVPNAPDVDPQATQERLAQVIEGLFTRLLSPENGSLVLLILEDLQWADNESMRFLQRLIALSNHQPLLILSNYRDDEAPDLPKQLPGTQSLRLNRLAANSIAELSVSILGPTGNNPELINYLQQETEGNVFFLVEVVRTLASEAGYLEAVSQADLTKRVFSGGMQKIIERRLNHLPQNYRPLLEVAAMIGRQLDVRLLDAFKLTPAIDVWLTDSLDSAVLELYDAQWRFAHDKLREGLLADLTPDKRISLHKLIAEVTEKVYPDSPEHMVMLAYHWGMAGNIPKERHYNALSSEQALINGANQDALRYASRAIALYDSQTVTDFELGNWKRLLGQAYFGMGRMPESFAHYSEAVKLYGAPIPSSVPGLVLGILRQAAEQFWHRLHPRTRRNSDANVARLLQGTRAYEIMATIMYWKNDVFRIVFSVLAELNLAENIGEITPELVRGYGSNSIVIFTTSLRGLARYYGRLARSRFNEINNPSAMQWVLELEGINDEAVGNWEKAEATQQQSTDIAREIGAWKNWAQSIFQTGYAKYYTGHFAESIAIWRQILDLGANRGDPQIKLWGVTGTMIVSLSHSVADTHIRVLEEMDFVKALDQDLSVQILAFGGSAVLRLRRGEYDLAQKAAAEGLRLIRSSYPVSYYSLSGYSGVAETFCKLWELSLSDQADALGLSSRREYFKKAAGQMGLASFLFAYLYPIAKPYVGRWRGLYQWLAGHPQRAMQAWKKSLKDGEFYKMPYEQALTHFEIGRHLPNDSPEKKIHLDQARHLFETLDAQVDLAIMDGKTPS